MEKEISSQNKNIFLIAIGAISTFIIEAIEGIAVAVALCTVLYLFLITPHEVIGQSMQPNFINGEYLVANKLVYTLNNPKRGDVIIFKHSATQDYIKRIIGLPGETVSIRNGKVYVNDDLLDESLYIDPAVYTNGGAVLKEGESYIVPEGEYFVLGDNRLNSSDSRSFGSISRESIKARAWIVYFPFNLFRIVATPEY